MHGIPIVTRELNAAVRILSDPAKVLDSNQVGYLTGVVQALRWVLMDLGTKPPTDGL